MDKTNFVIAFFLAALLAGLFLQFSPSPKGATKETFMQQELGKPLNEKGMGPYDQIGGGIAGWGSSEAMPVSQSPVNTHSDPNKLMLLVGNSVSSDCCPSAFNTDTGCVCLSEQDRRLFASRGGNRA
jgi:hypothetical protein